VDSDKRQKLLDLKRQIAAIQSEDRKAAKKRDRERKTKMQSSLSRSEGQRTPREKDSAYLNWIRTLPCTACGKAGPSQAAHIRSGYDEPGWRPTGMAEKPSDWRTAPLCRDCHLDGPKAQHRHNERSWWNGLGIYPPTLCAQLKAAYGEDDD
jgi:hypothetical protein